MTEEAQSQTPMESQSAQDAESTGLTTSDTPQDEVSEASENHGNDDTEKSNSGFQKRINKMTKKLRTAQDEANYWREQATKKQQPVEQKTTTEKPKQESFNTDSEYLEALADWKLDQRQQKQSADAERENQQKTLNEKRQKFSKSAKEAAKKYNDFNDVVSNPDIAISETMEQVILESEVGPDVLYHLGQNLDIALEIAQMPPHMAAREIGKIEARLSIPAQKKTTNAPPPMKPLGGKSSSKPDPKKMSTAEWIKWRNNE